MLKKEYTDSIIKLIKKSITDVLVIYIYGSHADDTATDASDIDIAILTKQEHDSVKIFELSTDISVELSKSIDLVDLAKADIVLQFEAIRHHKKIWCSADFDDDQFEDKIIREYYDHKLDMLPIYKEIKRTGIVNG